MKCDKATELISAYCEGDLSPALAVPFEAHLAGCSACRTVAAQVGAIHAGLSEMPLVSAPPSLRPEVWRRIEGSERVAAPAPRWYRRFTLRRLAATGAVAVLAVGLFTRAALPGVFRPAGWLAGVGGSVGVRDAAPFAPGSLSVRAAEDGATLAVPVTNRSLTPIEVAAYVDGTPADAAPAVTLAPRATAVLSATAPRNAEVLVVRWRQGERSGEVKFRSGARR